MLTITRHAFLRAKERLGLSQDAFRRIAAMAFCYGMPGEKTKGRLYNFIHAKAENHPNNVVMLYGENLFVFKDEHLITVYQLPRDFRNYFLKIKKEEK